MADAMNDLEVITCDDDWVDLRTGESAIVRGKVANALAKGATAVMVTQPDWSDLLIDIPLGAEKDIARGARVEITVTRSEDGLEATPRDITIKEE